MSSAVWTLIELNYHEREWCLYLVFTSLNSVCSLRIESGISFLLSQQRSWLCFSSTCLRSLFLSCYKEGELEKILAQDMTQRSKSCASFFFFFMGKLHGQYPDIRASSLSDSRLFALFSLVFFCCSVEWCGTVSGVHFLWVDLSLSEVAWNPEVY